MTGTELRNPDRQADRRFHELDSLRGIAALTVVLHHFSRILPDKVFHLLIRTPLRLLVAGHQAVILFFLLSGFVLTLPYKKKNRLDYGPFLLKRVCRIYLPYLGALALAVLCDLSFPSHLLSTDYWLNLTWSEPVTARLVLQHITFLGNYDWAQLNTAFWSLVYEMRISLFFPFLAIAVLGFRTVWLALFAVALSLCAFPLATLSSSTLHLASPGAALDTTLTLHYAAFFLIGSIMAKHLAAINRWYSRLTPTSVTCIVLASLCVYCFADASSIVQRFSIPQDLFDWPIAAAAVIFIVLAIDNVLFRTFLSFRATRYLGERSFSLYLVHGTILFALIHRFLGQIRLGVLLLLYLAASLLVAEIFYRLIERPAMLLGRHLTAPAKTPSQPTILVPTASGSQS
ncbi:acyltransferase [Tunturibacter psychrotolerans]|uniref:Acyltransferase n=1 Tax=Tunturiibacter psychrotolerans TaxID=3069686 RepID=A0AAU7ZQB3_9BACT